jgi:hypothetical protein
LTTVKLYRAIRQTPWGKPVGNVNPASCVKLVLCRLVLLIQPTTVNLRKLITAGGIGDYAAIKSKKLNPQNRLNQHSSLGLIFKGGGGFSLILY